MIFMFVEYYAQFDIYIIDIERQLVLQTLFFINPVTESINSGSTRRPRYVSGMNFGIVSAKYRLH